MTRNPCAPTPMKAMLTLSLGGMNPAPPSTRRGTIIKPAAAAAVLPRNSRRDTAPLHVFFATAESALNRFKSPISHLAAGNSNPIHVCRRRRNSIDENACSAGEICTLSVGELEGGVLGRLE